MKNALLAGAMALGVAIAAPAQAAVTVVGPTATAGSCASVTFVGIAPTQCAGGYTGNLINGNVDDANGLAALAALGAPGGVFIEKLPSLSPGNTVNFNTLLTGMTVIGIHYGGGSGLGNATSFFKFDAGAGVDSFTFSLNGLSNAAIFSTGGGGGGGLPGPVPEPTTWAMMLAGFAVIGAALRRRQRQTVRVSLA